jgi:hypothetical protein
VTPLARVVEELSNALQTAVLLVEHLERTVGATQREVTALGLCLRRAADALASSRLTISPPDEAFLFERSIDIEQYDRHRDKLREELTLVQMDRHASEPKRWT